MKESYLYEKLPKSRVRCNTCRHYCIISKDRRGICGVRGNIDGKLYSLVYGEVIAEHIDPIEKKPLYHFLPHTFTYSIATVGCNFRCDWCQNWQISQSPKPENPIQGFELTPAEIVKQAKQNKCPSISYTYTEPTIFLEYALDTMKLAHRHGLANIWVSNGYMSKETLKLILPYLDAINVDLKSFKENTYQKYCGAKLKPILENLKTIAKSKVHLEITTLVIPGINDSTKELKQIAQFIARELGKNIPWHISRFFPAYKLTETAQTPLEILKTAATIGKQSGLQFIHLGNIFESLSRST